VYSTDSNYSLYVEDVMWGTWNLVENRYQATESVIDEAAMDEADKEIVREYNATIKKVTEDLSNYKFNTAVSTLMILMNKLDKYKV